MLRAGALPDEALAAASQFHAAVLPQAIESLEAGHALVLVFDFADHTHREWRLGAVLGLARRFAPVRVNALVGEDEAAIAAGAAYLDAAPGITGQLLALDGTGAGPMLYPME